MKKLIFTLFAVLTVFAVFAQNKQNQFICGTPNADLKGTRGTWAEAGDFTATDIDGNTHTLSTYLNAGKTVIIDFSCAWCAPCWSLHQSGVLDDLHNTYGPEGSDEVVVLWVEVEGSNTLAQITGTEGSTGNYYADHTQGDWTEGGTWPVPIIDNEEPILEFLDLYEGYVPTVFMVCPSGYYKTITNQCTSAAAVYALIGSCPVTGQAPVDVDIDGPIWANTGDNVEFSATFASVDDVTYQWSFENATPATSDLANPTVVYNEIGTYNVYVTVTNTTGEASASHTITIEDCGIPITTFPYLEGFESGLGCWITIDNSDDDYTWTDGVSGTFDAHTGEGLVASPSYTASAGALSPDNWLISPPIQLGTGSSVSWWRAAQDAAYPAEHYGVYVSTTGTATTDFTLLYEETVTASGAKTQGIWRQRNVDLSSYTGTVYLAWRHFNCYDKFWLNIDDITINSTITGINSNDSKILNIFPNPANDVLNVNFAEGANIQIVNNLGQVVYSIDNAQELNKIDVSAFEAGSYFVKITKDNSVTNNKVVLVK